MYPTVTKIQARVCPVCAAAIDGIRVYSKHTNGAWNEEVTFKCNLVLHYSPNFGRVLKKGDCNQATDVALRLKGATLDGGQV